MEITEPNTALTLGCAIAIVVGIFGTVIPYVPGLLLCWAAVGVWAIFVEGPTAPRWIAFAVVSLLALLGTLLKFVLPGHRMHRQGVPGLSLFVGVVLAIVGFFVVPVVGLFLGFVLGVFLGELMRLGSASLAWPSTWKGVKAVGFSMLVEIGAGLLILCTWIVAVLLV